MEVDPVYLALSKLRKRQFDGCIDICTRLLAENPLDQVRVVYAGLLWPRMRRRSAPLQLIAPAGCLVSEMPRFDGKIMD
jgi:hypothetical protein